MTQVDLWRSDDGEQGIQLHEEHHGDGSIHRFICCCPCPMIDTLDVNGVRFGTCRQTMRDYTEHVESHDHIVHFGDLTYERALRHLADTAEAIEYWLQGNGDWDAIVEHWRRGNGA